MAVQKAVSLARTKHRAAEIADGKGRWTGRPQEDPGGSFPEGETSEHEVPETPASDQQPQEEEKIRVAPGQSLKPSTTDVFERLHAYHAASLEKKALLQKLAAQQVEAQAESLKRCTVRTCCSEEEALQIYGRLYQEAAHRRRRQVEREQEETLSSQCSTSSLRSQVEGPPRWEQLYHSAPLKEKRLGDERKRAAEAEERWLAQHCIHRSSDKTEASEIFDRLYGESESRERRREQRKAAEVASQVRELAESSVHTRTLSVADLELRTRRLYEDGLQRLQRLEERRLQESQPTEAPRRSASAGPSRFEMLYSDATRRDEDRKFWQKCHEKEELEMSQHQLAVKAPQCKRQVWAQRTPTPQKAPNSARNHQRGAATADVDELQMAQEAPLPAHSALVLPGQCLPERDLLPGGGSGRHQPKIPTVALNRANRNEGPAQGTPSGTAVRRAQSPVPVPGATSPLAAGSKLQSEPSAAASPSRSQTPRQRPQTRAGNSNGGKERASSAPRSSAAGTPVAEPTSGRPGVAAKDGLRAPRAEDLAAAGAKRGQSPMPHTPRAAASPVDGAKARCARTSDRLSPTRAPEEADTRSSSRAARATAICTPKVGPKKDATPPPRSKTPPPNAQAGLRPSGTMPSERGASTPPTKESPPERDKTPKATPRASGKASTPRAAFSKAGRGTTPPPAKARDSAKTPPKAQRNDTVQRPQEAPRAASRSGAIRTGAWPR
ncbi:ANP2 [Symbiodinium microadriaticum]|nr:ANP2 [Symbiodinium microadriaticum]